MGGCGRKAKPRLVLFVAWIVRRRRGPEDSHKGSMRTPHALKACTICAGGSAE